MMKIVSVNVGLPKDVKWRGEIVTTGIFKEPVFRRVKVGFLNLEGDRQADLTVHGGPDKAIYAYAAEHYATWKSDLNDRDLPWGMFGENLTVEGGLFEDVIFVGDRFVIGTAEAEAVQPRLPCYKLGIRFGTQRMVKKFAESGRFGVYFRVTKEGSVAADDALRKIAESRHRVSIGHIGRLLLDRHHDRHLLERASDLEALPEKIRTYFQSLLQ